MITKDIKIEDYTYDLPDIKIAKYPKQDRKESKLLVYNKSNISEKKFSDISEYFEKDDLLVFNETKVIQARLKFNKETGAAIEIFCLEPYAPADYERIFQTKNECSWKCIVGNLKKWKTGLLYKEIIINDEKFKISAEVEERLDNALIIKFNWDNTNISFGEILEQTGQTPIPPYLNRQSEEVDKQRYQTVYSKNKGSVAAPTAGLHFTDNVLNNLKQKGIILDFLTLHVGAGTFKPVKSETVEGHEMHTEHFNVSIKSLELLLNKKGKITATGTTTVRTLESIYWLGVKIIEKGNCNFIIKQWDAYELQQNIDFETAINAVIKYLKENSFNSLEAATQIIIAPGYTFRVINKLITNFHQPKSTLLLLIAALIGENWKDIYNFALNNDFRFLSYGDSSLIIP